MSHPKFQPFPFRLGTHSSTWVADYRSSSTVCFIPDAHTAACTRDQRTYLEIYGKTRQRALKFLTLLTLHRLDPSDAEITEYKMRFDLEKTCLCVDGWAGLGISPENGGAKASGLSFAGDIKRVALVIHDTELENNLVFLRCL